MHQGQEYDQPPEQEVPDKVFRFLHDTKLVDRVEGHVASLLVLLRAAQTLHELHLLASACDTRRDKLWGHAVHPREKASTQIGWVVSDDSRRTLAQEDCRDGQTLGQPEF
jgi:hypothetical protein